MDKKTTKKFTIALCAMAFALVAVVGGLIGVWAATAQVVGSNVNVQYQIGSNIAATIKANYATAVTTGAEQSVTFDATADQPTGGAIQHTLALGDVTLSPAATEVTFTFTFDNDSAVPFRATLVDTSMAANVTITYQDDTEGAITVTSLEATSINGTTYVDVDANAKGVTVEIKVEVAAANASSASYVSTAATGLKWTLDSAAYKS